ncbi:MAG: hypothetical protein EON58_14715 [Alphaproteobacteria bacterium]|nr:MAG: hypothetical protein EON58_14715 [Alphaproteobacteria bacterium]
MGLLDIEPIPGAGDDSAPEVGTAISLSDLPSGVYLRAVNGAALDVVYMGIADTAPALRVQVVTKSGDPVELTGCTATIHMEPRRPCGEDDHVVDADAVITAPAAGYLSYHWASGDTVAGSYRAEFVITDSGGAQITLPTGAGISVEIA